MNLRTREDWAASYDVTRRPVMTGLPVATVYVHHSVTVPTADADADMRGIENIDIGRFGVPSYSWVIHPDGIVLEGMGTHRGAHTINNARQSQNDIAFGVCFIGNFDNEQPTDAALRAGRELLGYLDDHSLLAAGWELRGHRDVYATACPGRNLYPRIQELRDAHVRPAPLEDDDMQWLIKVADDPAIWLTDFRTRRQVKSKHEYDDLAYLHAKTGGRMFFTPEAGTSAGGGYDLVRVLAAGTKWFDDVPIAS